MAGIVINESNEQIKERLIQYIIDNEVFGLDPEEFIKELSSCKGCPDNVIYEVLYELGLLPKKNNTYDYFLTILKKTIGLNKNLLEVGGGELAAFGNLVAQKQAKLKNGYITVMDYSLLTTKSRYPKLTLKKNVFHHNNLFIKEFDALIGLFPCGATREIIDGACMNHKDFAIALCQCTNTDIVPGIPANASLKQIHNMIIAYAKMMAIYNGLGNLNVIEPNSRSLIPTPIIFTKHKKKI